MSRRSRLSTLSALSGLSTTAKSNGDELYQYSLRVAYLAYLSSVRLLALKNEESSGTANLSSNLSKCIQGWIQVQQSLTRVSSSPTDLVKVLKVRIEPSQREQTRTIRIYHSDQASGVFYGYLHPRLLSQTIEGEPESSEALILLLVTTATGVLRKRLEGDKWKIYLNSQVGVFVTIIRDCLRSKELKGVPHELMPTFDSYASKLAPQQQRQQQHRHRHHHHHHHTINPQPQPHLDPQQPC
ncbi:hypothetical protein Pst134EA_015763 [Puccinia striiformis f. sp. tritici]|uniref:hypothetical protein n=1 Tax=Puccinia striiformis f. sp. tritici TaxID=168172 RepID=UPI0020080BCC|nr:hypothetical protein Pst134EA_015763 [Puccinia striiformis f. sp. tritici]KAH9463678.1 hypothetical protein Pst134EA_015763 [Puccinia striiformis f. sp. tritici]